MSFFYLHSVSVFKEVHHHVALVTGHPPLWSGGEVQHQDPTVTLHTLTDTQGVQRVLTGRVGAFITAHT